MKVSIKNKKGFTILEMLLYVSIVSVIVISISLFIQTMLSSRIKNQTITEVDQQGIEVMQQITQIIRNSQSITAPVTGGSAASLTVAKYDAPTNPTIIDIASNALEIKEGSGSYVPITSSRVAASGLSFQNLSRSGTGGTIRIQFTLTHVNVGNKNEYNYSKTFFGSADIRK